MRSAKTNEKLALIANRFHGPGDPRLEGVHAAGAARLQQGLDALRQAGQVGMVDNGPDGVLGQQDLVSVAVEPDAAEIMSRLKPMLK